MLTRFQAVLCVLSAATCWAQDARIIVGSTTASPGQSVSLPLLLQTGDTGISAIQWTINYSPSDLTLLSATPGPAATRAGKTLYCSDSPGAHVCLLVGFNSDVLADGEIARVDLAVVTGSLTPVRAVSGRDSVASTPQGDASRLLVIPGSVNLASFDAIPPSSSTVCDPTVSAAFATVPATGQAGKLTLGAPGSCAWNASSDVSWAQVFPLTGSGTSEISYNVTPNFTTTTRIAHLTLGGRTFTITQTGATGTYDQRFVGQIYFSFFGRYPTADEVAYHLLEGLAKGLSRVNLTSLFFNSGEFNAGGRFTAGLYVGLLDRDPEYNGWLFQRGALASGQLTQVDLVNNFLNSAEYAQRFGNPSNQEFIRLLYRYVLLREPTAEEINFHARELSVRSTRGQLAVAFLNSSEFRMGVEPRLTAFLLHSTLLLRDPSGLERSQRMAQIVAGAPPELLIEQFINSLEFTSRLQ